MITLNLIPEELKNRRKSIEMPDLPLIPIAATLITMLVVIQLLLSGLMFVSSRQLSGLEKTRKELAPKKSEFDNIKRKISAAEKKTRAIDALMRTQLNWARILNELSRSLTQNTWLTEMQYEEQLETGPPGSFGSREKNIGKTKKDAKPKTFKMRTLLLSGAAVGKGEEATAHIARFIRSLKENNAFFQDFDDIELVSIKKSFVAGEEVMDFTLACRFKREKPSN